MSVKSSIQTYAYIQEKREPLCKEVMGMAYVLSVGTSIPKYHVSQETAADFARGMFADSFKDIDRLLKAFQNGEIESRQFVRPIEWYKTARGFQKKPAVYGRNRQAQCGCGT